MNHAVRLWVSCAASAALAAASLCAGLASAAPAADGSAKAVGAALRSTLDAGSLRFDTTLSVGDVALNASGSADLVAGSATATVTLGDYSTECRHVGRFYYVNARQLGSPDEPWVALDSVRDSSQMSQRSVAGLATSVSPQKVLTALESATAFTRVGAEAPGDHYRIVVTAPRVSFVPLIDAFTDQPVNDGSAARIDVWVGANGFLTRLAVSTTMSTTVFSLSAFGSAVHITAPPASATGDLRSASGRYLFGPGVKFTSATTPAPRVTLDPTVALVDGVVQGNLHATSRTSQQMRFSFLSSSAGGKLSIGNVPSALAGGGPQSFVALPYAQWLDGQAKGPQSFRVQAREETRIDRYVTSLALIGDIAAPVIDGLQDTASVRSQLAPVIGATAEATITVRVNALAPGDTPIAMTYKVPGYRGTPISVNFIPASGLAAGNTAPTVLEVPGLGRPGNADPYEASTATTGVLGAEALRNAGSVGDVAYNVISWDLRGEFASGGTAELNNPFLDAVDVSAIIDWVATSLPATLNGFGDPAIGSVGGSSGGALALANSAIDPRLDATVPAATWNSLIDSLAPNNVVNTAATRQLLEELSRPDVRLNGQIAQGLTMGAATGRFASTTMSLLADKNLSPLLSQLQAPTLLIQSTNEAAFPVAEATTSAMKILSNPYGTPTKMIWFNGRSADPSRDTTLATYAKAWFNKYVSGVPIPDAFTPNFQWWDQTRTRYTSDLYPFDTNFNQPDPLVGVSSGGSLRIAPTGSTSASRLSVPVADVVTGQQVVGTPALTFTYKGTGSARALFASVIDASTHKVLGSGATPVPIVLDGKRHTVSIALHDISYTAGATPGLRLKLASTDPSFDQRTSGDVRIGALEIALPIRA